MSEITKAERAGLRNCVYGLKENSFHLKFADRLQKGERVFLPNTGFNRAIKTVKSSDIMTYCRFKSGYFSTTAEIFQNIEVFMQTVIDEKKAAMKTGFFLNETAMKQAKTNERLFFYHGDSALYYFEELKTEDQIYTQYGIYEIYGEHATGNGEKMFYLQSLDGLVTTSYIVRERKKEVGFYIADTERYVFPGFIRRDIEIEESEPIRIESSREILTGFYS